MALTILLSGFGPFPGAPCNPTGALVQGLARLRRPALVDVRLVPHVFQTSYRAVDRDLPRLLTELQPDAVLMFGVSAKARCLQVETRARNAISAFPRCRRTAGVVDRHCPGRAPRAFVWSAGRTAGASRPPGAYSDRDFAGCRTLSLQLSLLAGDRGDGPADRAELCGFHPCPRVVARGCPPQRPGSKIMADARSHARRGSHPARRRRRDAQAQIHERKVISAAAAGHSSDRNDLSD